MKIFKFGGASIADADRIRNVADIIGRFSAENILVVISALGKTTNALEEVANFSYRDDHEKAEKKIEEVKGHHMVILNGLFKDPTDEVFKIIEDLFQSLGSQARSLDHTNFNFYYDQIVSFGEMLSTTIVSHYLSHRAIENSWLDVRSVLKTDNAFREAKIDWTATTDLIQNKIRDVESPLIVTQGFIGCDQEGETTTLGREGSDFTAGIFAYILEADELVIWKDVPGVLNANPTLFNDTIKIDDLPYDEAIEMTYYGAQVIHPKTIKPLQNKNIPLRVRSFNDLDNPGTKIHDVSLPEDIPPIIVYKRDQVLMTFTTKDFSFMAEETLGKVYSSFGELRIKTNVMQNGAISLTVCIDHNPEKVRLLTETLKPFFNISSETGTEVLTIRHYTQDFIDRLTNGKEILITQRTKDTILFVIRAT